MRQKTEQIQQELKKVIVGKDECLSKILMAVLAGGHILLEDVPGVGKTQTAVAFSRVMNLNYHRVQFTADTMASDLVGFSIWNKESERLEYVPGAVFCNLLLADEINRTSAKTQAALLEVMEEQKVTVDGSTYDLSAPFVCIATQNPIGSAGTQRLPDSQLDRFMICLSIGYPSIQEQLQIVKARQAGINPLDQVAQVVTKEELLFMMDEVNRCYVHDDVVLYAARLCEQTRAHPDILQGVSPRGVLAFIQMAKGKAYVEGRDFVAPKDVKDLFQDVCGHRILLTAKARMHHMKEKDILLQILEEVKEPSILKREKSHK